MTDNEIHEAMFALFSSVYPHEAYEQDPELFWRQFQERAPGVSREEMVRLLGETGGEA